MLFNLDLFLVSVLVPYLLISTYASSLFLSLLLFHFFSFFFCMLDIMYVYSVLMYTTIYIYYMISTITASSILSLTSAINGYFSPFSWIRVVVCYNTQTQSSPPHFVIADSWGTTPKNYNHASGSMTGFCLRIPLFCNACHYFSSHWQYVFS